MNTPSSEKYPRTFHFPFSEGATHDDRIQADWESLLLHELVITEKLDGENTCLKTTGVYARSHGAVNRNAWARPIWDIWQRIGGSLGDLHIFGENLYAIHSIEYAHLTHYFYVFAIRHADTWLSWDETAEYAALLDLPLVPTVAKGTFSAQSLQQTIVAQQQQGSRLGGDCEGVVVRRAESFDATDFSQAVLKYVRKNHVQTDAHWTRHWRKATLHNQHAY